MLRSRLFTGLEKLSLIRFFAALATAKPEKLGPVSLAEWLDAKISQPRVRHFAEALAFPTIYTSARDVVTADVFVDKLQRAVKHPVHYLDNGWQTLVDGLEAAARTAGARIALETRATALAGSTDRMRTVLNDGTTVEADRVIVATPPQQAAQLLRSYPAGQRAVSGWSITPWHVACLDVALERLAGTGASRGSGSRAAAVHDRPVGLLRGRSGRRGAGLQLQAVGPGPPQRRPRCAPG
jgi:phytoene dehydrogenase-like protein